MNNENLIPHNFKNLAPSKQREIAKKGGEAVVRKKREQKSIRQIVNAIFNEKKEVDGRKLTEKELYFINFFRRAKSQIKTDGITPETIRATELLMKIIGEYPQESINLSSGQEPVVIVDNIDKEKK